MHAHVHYMRMPVPVKARASVAAQDMYMTGWGKKNHEINQNPSQLQAISSSCRSRSIPAQIKYPHAPGLCAIDCMQFQYMYAICHVNVNLAHGHISLGLAALAREPNLPS